MNWEKLAEIFEEFYAAVGKRVLCMQEVSGWLINPAVEEWLISHGEASAAVAVPYEIQCEIRWTHNSDVTSSVLLWELGVLCAYFANSCKSMEEFEKSKENHILVGLRWPSGLEHQF